MTGGVDGARWVFATQWWHRLRQIGDLPSRLVGLPDAAGAEPSLDVEEALGSAGGLTLIVADRGEDAARSLHRAMRLMLGDLDFVRLAEPHAVDLADVLALSRHRASRRPLLLFVDDAAPALLDQFDDATRALLDDQVRSVVVARASFLEAYLPDAATTVLQAAPRAVLAPTAAAAVSAPTERVERAVVDVVTDWDRLGLGPALTPTLLAPLVAAVLPPEDAAPDERGVRRAIRQCVRADHVHRSRRRGETHLAPARGWLVAADGEGELGRPVPETLATVLRDRLAAADRIVAGRVALARGERDVAARLLSTLPPESVPPAAAELVGSALLVQASTQEPPHFAALVPYPGRGPSPVRRSAIAWLRSAADRGDPDLRRRATRDAGLAAYVGSDLVTARTLLRSLDEDETDRHVQVALADVVTDDPEAPDGRAEARRRYEVVLAGGDDDALGIGAAAALARMAMQDGRSDDAVPLLATAGRTPDAEAAHTARLQRLHLLRELGRNDEEEQALDEMREQLGPDAPAARRQDVAIETAVTCRRRDDLEGVAVALAEAAGGGGVAGLRAAVDLAELELFRERWAEALAALGSSVGYLLERQAPEELLVRRHAARGEAAFRLGDMDTARAEFAQLSGDAHALLRLGEIALAGGDVPGAYRRFAEAHQAAPGSADAARAAELAAPIRVQAERIAAEQRAAAAARAAAFNIMPA